MRTAYWDSGDPEMYWGNPNLRWGYLPEPGDPGYVNPSPSVNTTKNKKTHMKRQDYYPSRMAEQIAWLLNFAGKLPGKATLLGLAPATVTALVADALWLAYVLQNWLDAVRTFSLGCTQTATAAMTGTNAALVTLPGFSAPALPTGVTPQNEGSLTRLFTAVQDIKNGHKITDAIAVELGIVGGADNGPDLSTVQPVISAKVSGSGVDVKWGWQGNSAWLDSCEIQVDRGDGKGFNLLTIDTTPNYTDTQPFPTAKAAWTYKAIYRLVDKQVGLWSATVSVAVPA